MHRLVLVLVLIALCAGMSVGASEATVHDDGPRVALRLVVQDSYEEGLGRCSLEVKSSFGRAFFVVKDSGISMHRIFPGQWHVASVRCARAVAEFPEEQARFEIPDSAADLSLGTLVVDFSAVSIFNKVEATKDRRRLVAGAAGYAVAGVVAGVVAAEVADGIDAPVRVNVEADLRRRLTDRVGDVEIAAIMGHAEVKRVNVRVLRRP